MYSFKSMVLFSKNLLTKAGYIPQNIFPRKTSQMLSKHDWGWEEKSLDFGRVHFAAYIMVARDLPVQAKEPSLSRKTLKI